MCKAYKISKTPQLLDPLNQPAVLSDAAELELLSPDHQFEVVGGRLNQADLNAPDLERFWALVSARSRSGAQLRLLIISRYPAL